MDKVLEYRHNLSKDANIVQRQSGNRKLSGWVRVDYTFEDQRKLDSKLQFLELN